MGQMPRKRDTMTELNEAEQSIIDFVNTPNKDPRWANPHLWSREELFGEEEVAADEL
ncbi:hypothetical protein GCM10027591_08250 [Zhihengliuella somnathii]